MLYPADAAHIERIRADVALWYAHRTDRISERLMPPALLTAYTQNLLEYSRQIKNKNCETYRRICEALDLIARAVMAADFVGPADCAMRAEILDVFHRYGNDGAGQHLLEL